MKLTVRQTSLPEVLVVEHEVFEDQRGFFMEVYRADQFAAHAGLGLPSTFVQVDCLDPPRLNEVAYPCGCRVA